MGMCGVCVWIWLGGRRMYVKLQDQTEHCVEGHRHVDINVVILLRTYASYLCQNQAPFLLRAPHVEFCYPLRSETHALLDSLTEKEIYIHDS